jgi:hypothetical protein
LGRPRSPVSEASPWHGTANGYSYHKCRCDLCVEANRIHQLEMTTARGEFEVPDHVHGTYGGYANYRCPCELCRSVYRAKQAEYRERRRQKA